MNMNYNQVANNIDIVKYRTVKHNQRKKFVSTYVRSESKETENKIIEYLAVYFDGNLVELKKFEEVELLVLNLIDHIRIYNTQLSQSNIACWYKVNTLLEKEIPKIIDENFLNEECLH